ncbi:FAD-dependent oxidoreductase [Streptacidiphilus sp. MAP5-3]|uniref:FAD-dependent oxidoreductase n=2 Tax=Streptacidiphilus TaxID=228398 RepID=UPI003517B5BB
MSGIIVIGGGIAGSAAALALHKAGFEVTVHEAHPVSGADIGAFLTLASNGMRALAQFDAAEAVAAEGFELTWMNVLDAEGAELASVPLGDVEHPLTRFRCLRRAELAAALQRELSRRGIAIRHGARLVGVDDTDDGVTARFTDGTSAQGELLVAADGLRSVVRSSLTPDTQPDYAGQAVFYGYTTEARPPHADGRITMVRGSGTAFGYAVSPAGETYWFARVPGPALTAEEIGGTKPAEWRERLLPLLRPDRTPTADIVAATTESLMATNAMHLTPGLPWRGRRTVLIGDAAHAASPATGQGASMALEDAVVLAKALRDSASADAALDAYEAHRRPRAEQNVTNSARLTASRTTAVSPDTTRRQGPSTRVDEDVQRTLDWNTTLPAAPSEN